MRIVIVSLGFGRNDNLGGSVRVASTNAVALAKLGHQVSYICTNRIDKKNKLYPGFHKQNIDGVDVYFLNTITVPFWPGDFGPHLSAVPSIVRRVIAESEIVHINEYRSFLTILISTYASFYNIPIAIQPHGTFLNHGNRILLKYLYNQIFNLFTNKASKFFIASTSSEKQIFLSSGINEESIKIIPNGISSVYTTNFVSGNLRKSLDLYHNDIILLSIGRLDKLKGFQYVIQSLVHLPDHIKYLIIGPDQQNYINELQKIIQNLNLKNRVLFLGPINDRGELYNAIFDCDIFIVPSIVEAFGMVILEASLCRKPIILSNNCNIIKDLPDNVTLNVSLNPSEIANSILKLTEDKELSIKLTNKFYQFTLENYSIESVAKNLESFYYFIKSIDG